jgi:hypothetical protein
METRKDEKKSEKIEKKSKFRIEDLEERIAPATYGASGQHGPPHGNSNQQGP